MVRKCVHGIYKVKAKFSFSVFGVIEFPLKMKKKRMLSLLPRFLKAGLGFSVNRPSFNSRISDGYEEHLAEIFTC